MTPAQQKAARKWKTANRDKTLEQSRDYYARNRDVILRKGANRRAENREKELERHRQYRVANADKIKAIALEYRESNREREQARSRKWQSKNPDRVREINKKYRSSNSDKLRERQRQYNFAKPWLRAAYAARRRASKNKATPPWVDQAAIAVIYAKAAASGLTVDHIIPLKHPAVCGLHVPWNLQLLSSFENSRKWNRFEHKGEPIVSACS